MIDTNPAPRLWSDSKSAVSPDAVLPSRSSLQQTTFSTAPIASASSSRVPKVRNEAACWHHRLLVVAAAWPTLENHTKSLGHYRGSGKPFTFAALQRVQCVNCNIDIVDDLEVKHPYADEVCAVLEGPLEAVFCFDGASR